MAADHNTCFERIHYMEYFQIQDRYDVGTSSSRMPQKILEVPSGICMPITSAQLLMCRNRDIWSSIVMEIIIRFSYHSWCSAFAASEYRLLSITADSEFCSVKVFYGWILSIPIEGCRVLLHYFQIYFDTVWVLDIEDLRYYFKTSQDYSSTCLKIYENGLMFICLLTLRTQTTQNALILIFTPINLWITTLDRYNAET